MFDAYTVKKVLPRLVIAVVLIQLSWFIFTGMIALTNAIAYGVEGLIYAPFGGIGNLGLSDILSYTGGGGGGFFVAMAAGVITFGTLSLFGGGALALAGIAALSLAIGFLLLLFRQVILVALLIISPLAIVAWILPNTEKFWKLWWESFSKLLLVYPLILGVIAVGRVFAYIIAGADPSSGEGIINTPIDNIATMFMIVVALFGPYILIPKLFQLAGGAFVALKGLADGQSQGVFGKLRKSRDDKRKQVKETGQVLRNAKNPFTQRINKMSSGVALGAGGAYGFGRRGMAGREEQVQHAANSLAKDAGFTQAMYDDNVRAALQAGSAENAKTRLRRMGKSEDEIKDALAHANRIGFGRASEIAAWKHEGANKGRNYKGENAVEQINADLAESAARGGIDETGLREEVAYGLRSSGGRFDLGALSTDKPVPQQILAGWQKGSLYQLGNGQAEGVAAAGRAAQALLATGDEGDAHQAAMIYEEIDALSKSASGGVRDEAMRVKAELDTADPATGRSALESYYAAGPTEDAPVYGETTVTVPNPAVGAPGHDPAAAVGADITRTRKTVIGTKPVSSRRARASREARKYEPPDPNNM